jgi:hypothetical protein
MPSKRTPANVVLDRHVASIHAASNASYGRARITQELRIQGYRASAQRVRRSLRRQGALEHLNER